MIYPEKCEQLAESVQENHYLTNSAELLKILESNKKRHEGNMNSLGFSKESEYSLLYTETGKCNTFYYCDCSDLLDRAYMIVSSINGKDVGKMAFNFLLSKIQVDGYYNLIVTMPFPAFFEIPGVLCGKDFDVFYLTNRSVWKMNHNDKTLKCTLKRRTNGMPFLKIKNENDENKPSIEIQNNSVIFKVNKDKSRKEYEYLTRSNDRFKYSSDHFKIQIDIAYLLGWFDDYSMILNKKKELTIIDVGCVTNDNVFQADINLNGEKYRIDSYPDYIFLFLLDVNKKIEWKK